MKKFEDINHANSVMNMLSAIDHMTPEDLGPGLVIAFAQVHATLALVEAAREFTKTFKTAHPDTWEVP